MMNDSERCVNAFQGCLQLSLSDLQIQIESLLRSKYALFFCKLQSIDCQVIAKLKRNHGVKLR